jgi:plasmid stability protein
MKRTQIQLEEETYQELRRRAADEGKSVAAIVREIVRAGLAATPQAVERAATPKRRLRIEDFTFIGSGSAEPSRWDPISENHDDALAEDLLKEIVENRDKSPDER